MTNNIDDLGIAIIGLAGRFPGAANVDAFWQNLCAGVESIHFFSDEELEALGVEAATRRDPHYVRARAMLDEVESFDAGFFGFNPKEAEIMDPQQRVLLECAWAALENAGYDPETYPGSIGVYAGATISTYLLFNIFSNPAVAQSLGHLQIHLGNAADFLTTRISYKLNLKGPSYLVESACSTSLVAAHVACQSLLNEECDMALAGGVSINVKQRTGYRYLEGGMESPDGRCRAFDAAAQGTIFGSGAGLVVLKRLEDALADGDHIHAVIKGSAINNDGSLKVGYTAPSVEGQAEVITEALANAGVSAKTISYVESHGTGTSLGDPIEIQALTKAFRAGPTLKSFCAIGSVKTNVGHLEAAAGAASLIKTALALEHKQIPPSLHFDRPNPQIDFDNSPFYVNTQLADWKTNGHPRRAGVSSFGFGGTNAHVILEEAPAVEASGPSRPWHTLLLSAKSETALENAAVNLAQHWRQHPELNLADVAYTLQVGRRAFTHRRVVVCQTAKDALAALEGNDPPRVFAERQEARQRPVAFLLSGQGTQYPNMSRGLYESEPLFCEQVDRCAELLKPHLGRDIRELLYPSDQKPGFSSDSKTKPSEIEKPGFSSEAAAEALTQTANAQVALFVIEYALAQLWMSWGIKPVALLGHSLGEYVAACLAGVFSLEDGLKLVAARGRLMQSVEPGAMLSVTSSEAEVQKYLTLRLRAAHPERSEAQSKETPRSAQGAGLWLAAVNAPKLTVLSGTLKAIAQLEQQLTAEGIGCRRLVTSHAFHSGMMDGIVAEFVRVAKTIKLNAPKIPYISNVSGTWITADEATNAEYWGRHIRAAVRFGEGVVELLKEPDLALLEVGPGRVLSTLAKQTATSASTILTSLRSVQEPESDEEYLLRTVGKLWLAGVEIDWRSFYAGQRRLRVPLPTYPFERQRYWIEPQSPRESMQAVAKSATPFGKKSDLGDWFYLPTWERSLPISHRASRAAHLQSAPHVRDHWLVFVDASDLGGELVKRLRQASQEVIEVTIGDAFSQINEVYRLRPGEYADYAALFADLNARGKAPSKILHLWSVTQDYSGAVEGEAFEQAQAGGFYSLVCLARALANWKHLAPLQINVITNNLHDVSGVERTCPEKATLLGACKVIPQEYPYMTCRCVDVVLPESVGHYKVNLVNQLIAEITGEAQEPVIAYRGDQRWVQSQTPIRLEPNTDALPALREKGVYLITGGLSGVGFALATYLAQSVRARLILVEAAALPERNEWAGWLAAHADASRDQVSLKIKRVQSLEGLGAEVLLLKAEVTCLDQMQNVMTHSLGRLGEIHGVIHAAGAPADQAFVPILEMTPEVVRWHFGPKAHGLFVLEQILKDRELDFCVLDSSLATCLGGLGYAAYAAANLFLNAFAHRHNQVQPVPWISVNWEAWHLGEDEAQIIALSQELAELALTPEAGGEVFRRILSIGSTDQVMVSTADLARRIEQGLEKIELTRGLLKDRTLNLSPGAPSAAPVHPRPQLQNPYVAPSTEMERKIAGVWQKALGFDRVGITDSFFDLGGDSFAAMHVMTQLKKDLNLDLPVVSLYEGLTIKTLVALLNSNESCPAQAEVREAKVDRRREFQQKQRERKN